MDISLRVWRGDFSAGGPSCVVGAPESFTRSNFPNHSGEQITAVSAWQDGGAGGHRTRETAEWRWPAGHGAPGDVASRPEGKALRASHGLAVARARARTDMQIAECTQIRPYGVQNILIGTAFTRLM